jgi:hypothetical protein
VRDDRWKRDRPEDEEEEEKKDRDGGNRGVVIIDM